jgi:hypothetical protein
MKNATWMASSGLWIMIRPGIFIFVLWDELRVVGDSADRLGGCMHIYQS